MRLISDLDRVGCRMPSTAYSSVRQNSETCAIAGGMIWGHMLVTVCGSIKKRCRCGLFNTTKMNSTQLEVHRLQVLI